LKLKTRNQARISTLYFWVLRVPFVFIVPLV
jgi:hypothetical protein